MQGKVQNSSDPMGTINVCHKAYTGFHSQGEGESCLLRTEVLATTSCLPVACNLETSKRDRHGVNDSLAPTQQGQFIRA